MPPQEPLIGVLNAGSSSLKFAIYEGETKVLTGQISGLGASPVASAEGINGEALEPPYIGNPIPSTAGELLPRLLPWARAELKGRKLAALGHRVVHGGMHTESQLVTSELLDGLDELVGLAPLHQPHSLSAIRIGLAFAPDLPQVACFDTAFHRSIPEIAQAFALPRTLFEEGIRRYGFHGLSYEYIASVLPEGAPEVADGRVVVAHLGNGASLCALKSRKSVATTMGFTALDGLPMGTRCGDLDPGVMLYLMQQKKLSAAAIEDLLYWRSGLRGLSELSSDVRDLLSSRDPLASFAIEVFCYQTVRHIGSMAAALGGVDGIVFTGGIGENAATIRSAICQKCRWLGVELDETANLQRGACISTPKSRVRVYVIPTDENVIIARDTRLLLDAKERAAG